MTVGDEVAGCLAVAREALGLLRGCAGTGAYSLYADAVRACHGALEGFVEARVAGLRLVIPATQLPEALLNLAHVVCLREYALARSHVPRPGWTVVDLGAYLGFYTVWAARLVGPRGRVVAVEPNHEARRLVYENAVANDVDDRVEVDPRAVWDSEGYGVLHVPGYWGNASLDPGYASSYGDAARVPVRLARLETVLADHGVEVADLVKVDVEAAEARVLRGVSPARAHRLVVELHPPWAGPETLPHAYRWLLVHALSTGSQVVAYGLAEG